MEVLGVNIRQEKWGSEGNDTETKSIHKYKNIYGWLKKDHNRLCAEAMPINALIEHSINISHHMATQVRNRLAFVSTRRALCFTFLCHSEKRNNNKKEPKEQQRSTTKRFKETYKTYIFLLDFYIIFYSVHFVFQQPRISIFWRIRPKKKTRRHGKGKIYPHLLVSNSFETVNAFSKCCAQ